MLRRVSFHYWIPLLILLLAIILHYLLPASMQTSSDILLSLAVIIHSYALWGTTRTVVYVICPMIIGYFAEFIGINTGLIFGPYYYNPDNQGMIFGVPFFIPVLYTALLYSGSFLCIAVNNRLIERVNLWVLSLMTAAVLTLKDVVTDPLQSTVNHVWTWTQGGSYFGVPIHNFAGWFIVFTLMTYVTLSLTWHASFYKKKANVKLNKADLVFPLCLFLTFLLFGITAAFNIPEAYRDLGNVSVFIAILGFIPYFLLAWFNNFKKS